MNEIINFCTDEYLTIRIRDWYVIAKTDYNIDGCLIKIEWNENEWNEKYLYIEAIENGKIVKCVIAYPQEYTKEQLYSIWMEKAE